MKHLNRNLILGMLAALLLAVAIPSSSLAQGRGQGRGRGNIDWSNRNRRDDDNRNWRRSRNYSRNYNKKCGKFVNCHDARNGRWDGRGPSGTRVGNYVWRDGRRVRVYNTYLRNRNRRYYRRVMVNR